MEILEKWNIFLNKKIRVIIDDRPEIYPKHKDGILKAITPTHLILQRENGQDEALRISDIRRVEVQP
jgi:hypothetical protein